MSVLADLVEKLKAEGLTVYTGPPGQVIEPPAVMLSPGSPDWLTPDTFATAQEAVRASAVALSTESDPGINTLRRIGKQIWEAAADVGAGWQGAAPPAIADIQGQSFLVSTHRLTVPLEEE